MLNDLVASQILGEIDTVTKRIDQQINQLEGIEPALKNGLDRISAVTTDVESKARATVEMVILKTVHETNLKLALAVEKTATQVAQSVAKKDAAKWVSIATTASCVALLMVGLLSFQMGKKTGLQIGYSNASDEKSAASWANTTEGRVAKELAEFGSIDHLANCDRPGWVVIKKESGRICSPQSAEEGLYGWRIE